MTTNTTDTTIEDRKRAAVAEVRQHQERKRLEREAREAAALSVDQEIAREIRARRADEERRAFVQAGSASALARTEAARAAATEEDRKLKEAGNPHLRTVDSPAHRVAQLLRRHLGDQFNVLVEQIAGVDWKSLKNAIEQIPINEAAEVKHAAEQVIAARLAEEALTLPAPEDDEEVAILASYGFTVEKRAAELIAGAL